MTEMDQHGGISPSHSDDGSEEQQQSYDSESEDIDVQGGKAKMENVSENINNGKGCLESADASNFSDEAADQQSYEQATQRHESGGSSGKRRRSRWDPIPEEGRVANEGECSGKKKRSRWAAEKPNISILGQIKLPDFMKEFTCSDREVQELNVKLYTINWRLQTGNIIVASGDGQRSPSPEPLYNNLGIRINTREVRAREKLAKERQMIIAKLIEKNPSFKPPADTTKPMQQKKLYIPAKEYPGYNFVGLIIGPRGNTLKRMEQESGAKIYIRGRGSSLHRRDHKPDPSDNEDLHVLVEADTENSLEKACGMVEKLLVPVEEGKNVHKWAQLRELAEIKGTKKDYNNICRICGQDGHIQFSCPKRGKGPEHVMCITCGGEHSTLNCPTKVSLQGGPTQSIQPLGPADKYIPWLPQAGGLEHPQNRNVGIGPEITRVSMEKTGSGLPAQSTQPLGFTDNYMSWLAGRMKHPENGNAGIGPEMMRVSMEKSGSGLPIQSNQPPGFTDNYMSWLAGGLEHPENGNAGMVTGKVSLEKSGSGFPARSIQPLGLTDNYLSRLPGSLEHPENVNARIEPEVRKGSVEKSGSGLPRQSTQPLGFTDSYMSWLTGGLEHTKDGNAGIGPDIRKGGGFGTSSIQSSRSYGYSPYSSHVGVESSFDSPSLSHMGLGSRFEHNHGKEIDQSNVFVGYLPPTMDEEQLIKLFSSFGIIVEAKVIRDHVDGSCKGYGFVKFNDIHCAAKAIAHMNGYRLEGKTLAVRVLGCPPSGSGAEPAEGLYTVDKQQPPRLPVHSGDYAQPSWSVPTRPVSSFPYNPYSNNNVSGMPSHSVSPLQGGTFNSLPATPYSTYGLYQMPLPSAESSSDMQGSLKSQEVLGSVHDSSMSKLNVHSGDAMGHFSANQARITTYQRYAHPSIPSGSAYSESAPRGSLMGGLVTPSQSSSLFSSGYEKKAVELEYERFLSEMGP